MNSLNLLLLHKPSWVDLEGGRGGKVSICVCPSVAGSTTPRTFYLELRASRRGGVAVYEQAERRQFPSFCLERHINDDSSFCVFYGSERRLATQDDALNWWSLLEMYLANQTFAERHKLWPLGSGLSHGSAADNQIEMEKLADLLGWKDEILEGIFRRRGWLAERLPRASLKEQLVVNSRSPCPRGCTWKHKLLRKDSCNLSSCSQDCTRDHKPIVRADCPNRKIIEGIILHEHRRQEIEAEIIQKRYREGRRCCGTMKFCPLRDLSES